jgi:hypothetical protein
MRICALLAGDLEQDGKLRPFARAAFHHDLSAMPFDDIVGQRLFGIDVTEQIFHDQAMSRLGSAGEQESSQTG